VTISTRFSYTVLRRSTQNRSLDGIARYTEELGRALVCSGGISLEPYVLGRGEKSSTYADTDAGRFHAQALFSLLTSRPFPVAERRLGSAGGLVHATDHFIPKLRRVPVVATLHDAIPLSRPEWINYSFKRLKNSLWRRSAHWAQHILTVSEFSKKEIAEWFGIPTARITVTPLGVGRRWFATYDREELAQTRERYGLPERFFLFIGTLQPRKNLLRLIEAHHALPAGLRASTPLVVGGRAGWSCDEELKILHEGDGGSLRWLQHVPEEDLVQLFQTATAFVLPSLHEGFGLPVVEAFASGTPVVASNAGSIPEVAGEAAMLFDPMDIGAMANAMRRVVEDRALAETLRGRGRERARLFTWERTAELTVGVYRQVLADWKS
jgi:glycosyltransferase involved in cell wall biosynthesis